MKRHTSMVLLALGFSAGLAPVLAATPPSAPAAAAPPIADTSALTVDTQEAAYIRKIHQDRRELEEAKMQAAIADERLKTIEAVAKAKKVEKGGSDKDAADDTDRPGAVRSNVGEANAAGEGGPPPLPRPREILDQTSKPAPAPHSAALLPPADPKVTGISNGEAQIDYDGQTSGYRAGDVFDNHRVIDVGFDSVLMEMPDGTRKRLSVSWPRSN